MSCGRAERLPPTDAGLQGHQNAVHETAWHILLHASRWVYVAACCKQTHDVTHSRQPDAGHLVLQTAQLAAANCPRPSLQHQSQQRLQAPHHHFQHKQCELYRPMASAQMTALRPQAVMHESKGTHPQIPPAVRQTTSRHVSFTTSAGLSW